MNNFNKITMIFSLVGIIICFGASLWMSFALSGTNEDATFFYVMDVLFLLAIVWFSLNIYSRRKDK